jgi:hypothetical protein
MPRQNNPQHEARKRAARERAKADADRAIAKQEVQKPKQYRNAMMAGPALSMAAMEVLLAKSEREQQF